MVFRKPEPSDPRRDAIARHMRLADELTRKRQYEQALFEIEKALEIDPKNNNVRQFYERVKVFHRKTVDAQKAKEAVAELTLEQRMEVIPKFLAQAEQLLAKRDYGGALAQLAEVYKIDPTNYYAQAFSDRIDQLITEEKATASKAFQAAAASSVGEARKGDEASDAGSLIFYRELLKEYWFDGKLNEKELSHLAEVRSLFQISEADHDRLSKEVRLDSYVEALRLAWIDGIITETERRVLESMRVKYGISPSENFEAEQRVHQLRKERAGKSIILIVDEDRNHGLALSKNFRMKGYEVAFVAKPEDAFQVLQTTVPAAILAEAKYTNSTTDGFELYHRVHMVPATSRVPFFFIVRITDRDMLLAALRTGVDHVLVKPADPDFILAAIDGKRRRDAS